MEYLNSQIRALINEYVHSDRDAEILRLRLIHGKTYQFISDRISENPDFVPVGVKQVYRIISREAAKLYCHLNPPPR